MSSKKITVVGFQYEPKRVGCAANTVNDNLYDDDVEEQQLSNSEMWSLRFTLDKTACITQHEDFSPVVFLTNTLWTVLVALHDQESHGFPKREDVLNR